MYNYIFEMTYTHFIIVNSCSVLRNIYVSGNHIFYFTQLSKKIFITIGNLFYIKTIIYQTFIYLYLFYFTLQFQIYWILLNSLFLNDLYIVYDF